MPSRQPPPRLWLMTDERQGAALWEALDRLPRGGAGIVFRHYGLPPVERRALFDRVRRIARARRLTLVLAGAPQLASAWRANGIHGRSAHTGCGGRGARPLLRTVPAHDARELVAAGRIGADLIFLSPIFATRSHIGARVLGPLRFGMLAHGRGRLIALGGMDGRRARRLAGLGSYGWAAIDGLTPGTHQNLKAVPT